MVATQKPVMGLYVDKTCPEFWIVRDYQGSLLVKYRPGRTPGARPAFQPTEETELEPIPGIYMYVLGLPL